MPIIFTLDKTLQRYNIQQKELAIESNTRPATISQMCQNKVVRINSEMLNRVLPALERLTGSKHTLDDIMSYVSSDEFKNLSKTE